MSKQISIHIIAAGLICLDWISIFQLAYSSFYLRLEVCKILDLATVFSPTP